MTANIPHTYTILPFVKRQQNWLTREYHGVSYFDLFGHRSLQFLSSTIDLDLCGPAPLRARRSLFGTVYRELIPLPIPRSFRYPGRRSGIIPNAPTTTGIIFVWIP